MRTCCTCPDEAGLHTPGPRHPLGQPDRLGQGSCPPASEVPSGFTPYSRAAGCAARNLGRRQGTRVRPVSGTASGVRARKLVSAMQTIATVIRHSSGHGIAEVNFPQPTRVSMVMKSMWDR